MWLVPNAIEMESALEDLSILQRKASKVFGRLACASGFIM